MSRKWKARNNGAYFCTTTVVDWIKVFEDEVNCSFIIESLNFYIDNRKLEIFSYCLMPNHLHLLVRTQNPEKLQNVMRDFKKYTSRQVLNRLEERGIYYNKFYLKNGKRRLWQPGYHAIEVYSPKVIKQKMNYIHKNPVKAGIVESPSEYKWSSATNYARIESVLDVILIE